MDNRHTFDNNGPKNYLENFVFLNQIRNYFYGVFLVHMFSIKYKQFCEIFDIF